MGLIAGGVACGDDDDHGVDAGPDAGPTADSGAAMKDASSGGGGSGGMGGGTGGMSATDAGDLYQCMPPAAEEGGSAQAGDACCGSLGVCKANVSGPGSSGYGLDECAAGKHLKCAPVLPAGGDADGGDEDGGSTGPVASCRVDLPANLGNFDLEGRCIPSCFVTADPSAANLGKSSCASGEKCVPCYSPVTAKSTGACNQAGDAPTEPAPPGFDQCGDGNIGYCVSSSAASMGGGSNGADGGMSMVNLQQLTCDTDQVCVPKPLVINQHACFAHCTSPFGPGGCISTLVLPAMTAMLLQQADCDMGEVCAPCISPLNMMRTGACNQR